MLSGFNLLTSVDLPVDRLPSSLGKRGPSCPKFVLSALCKSSRTLSPQPCQLLAPVSALCMFMHAAALPCMSCIPSRFCLTHG